MIRTAYQFSVPAGRAGSSRLVCELLLFSSVLYAQGSPASPPVRFQAQYRQIYSDNLETIAPTLTPPFSLGEAGSLTANPAEVVSGAASIKGSYFGSASNALVLSTSPALLPLAPNHSYTLTFQYKILTAPGNYFSVQFYSQTAGAQGSFLPGSTISGAAGGTGTVFLTSTLGNYSDYQAFWIVGSTGAISIDNIRITDGATGKDVASENAEAAGPTVQAGMQLQGGTMVTTDPALVVSGKGALLLSNRGGFATNPAVIPVGPNTVYTIRFDYRIVSPATVDSVFYAWFEPPGSTDQQSQVTIPGMFKNAALNGTFSTGAQTAGASSYVLKLYAAPGVTLVIDNFFVYRQDVNTQTTPPAAWNRLSTAPFPRLAKYMLGSIQGVAASGRAEGQPFTYTVGQIENRLAFHSVIAGLDLWSQTNDPDSIHRIRALNPNAVILPYRVFEGQNTPAPPVLGNTDWNYEFARSIPKEWKAADSSGNVIEAPGFPGLFFMNMSSNAPAVNGQTWPTALQSFLTTRIFSSGLWDGVFFDWLDGQLNGGFPHIDDPALLITTGTETELRMKRRHPPMRCCAPPQPPCCSRSMRRSTACNS